MSISLDGGANPASVEYNGNNVSEVWYKSSPTATAIMIWPNWVPPTADGFYYRFDSSAGILYVRGTSADGYTKYRGSTNANRSPFRNNTNIVSVITETPVKVPDTVEGMFYGCSSLTDITNPGDWDLSNTLDIASMFEGCTSLITIYINDWDVTKVVNAPKMFKGCTSLETLDLSVFPLHKCTVYNEMFANCTNLVSLDLSGINTYITVPPYGDKQYVGVRYMFSGCENLEHIYVGDAWHENDLSYSGEMFINCVKLPNWDGTTSSRKAYVGAGGYLERR